MLCGAGEDFRQGEWRRKAVAFAERNGFAVVATAFFLNFRKSDNSEVLLFESMLFSLASISLHPEVHRVPWMPLENSNGGQMSYGLAAKRPEKVIAFVASKGCCYNNVLPPEATLAVPGMLIAGEFDTAVRRTNIRNLYANNRARGALWAWEEEEEEEPTAHDDHNGRQLKFAFLAECYRLRYPKEGASRSGIVLLNSLH